MALPKLNSAPVYEMTVPSTGQNITYRPFLVKEQKNLLIAFESQNRRDLVRAVQRTIESCVEDNINNNLTTFDVDYMFTQLRSKSVGEKSTLVNTCKECGKKTDFTIDLDKINPPEVKKNVKISLTDSISVLMKYPSYDAFIKNEKLLDDKNQTEQIMEFIVECMDSIVTDDEQIRLKDESLEEIQSFVDSLTSDQFKKLSDYIANIPRLRHTFKIKCEHCGAEEEKSLEGLEDFF